MFDKLQAVEARYLEIEHKLGDPDLANRPDEFRRLSKEHASLQEVVAEYRHHRKTKSEIQSNKELLIEGDPEFSAMAKEELKALEPELEASAKRLQVLLLPQYPNDLKNVILEVRAGAGGEEAALFAGELYRLYQRYSERQGWRTEVMSVSQAEKGGLKEIILMIEGTKV